METWNPADMFFCPISMQIMTDPVSTVDGFTVRAGAVGFARAGARAGKHPRGLRRQP